MIYYFMTYDNDTRQKHIMNEFQNLKLAQVNADGKGGKNISGATGFSRILDLACINQEKDAPFEPFAIFEDDVKKYREFPSTIEIPDDADILYIGSSVWGMTFGSEGHLFSVCFKNVNKDIIRVYNMLTTHGIIICSTRGLLAMQKCILEDLFKNRPHDVSIAQMQPYLNAYALKNPLVYQYGKIGGQEKSTITNDYFNKKDRPIPKMWVNTRNISVVTNYNKNCLT